MAVVGAAFLLSVDGTLARIHVEYDAVGAIHRLGLGQHVPVHDHEPDQILLTGQQLGLEPMQRRRERCTAVPDLWRPDQAKRRIRREACRVVEVLIPGQAAVNRLPQQIGQPELRVQPLPGVVQVLRDEMLQPQAFIQLTDQNEARVGRDARPLERDF
jgi:hypothetical protein